MKIHFKHTDTFRRTAILAFVLVVCFTQYLATRPSYAISQESVDAINIGAQWYRLPGCSAAQLSGITDTVNVPKDMDGRMKLIFKNLLAQRTKDGKGLSPEQVSGIIGNLWQESSLNPAEHGGGIAQWIGSRWTALTKFAASEHKSPNDMNAQLDYLWHELNTGYKTVLAHVMAAKTVQDAEHQFVGPNDLSGHNVPPSYNHNRSGGFENPGLPMELNRIKYANSAMAYYKAHQSEFANLVASTTTGTDVGGSCVTSTTATGPGCGGSGKYKAIVSYPVNFAGVDQGIDFTPKSKAGFDICAPASGVITLADATGHHFSRTSGQAEIIEKLDQDPKVPNGSQFIYYAEIIKLDPAIKVGAKVAKGARIGHNDASPGIEVGWAKNGTIGFKCPPAIPTPCGQTFDSWVQKQ